MASRPCPGFVVGEFRNDVVRLIKEAIQFHFEGLKADGAPITQPSSEIEYIGITAT